MKAVFISDNGRHHHKISLNVWRFFTLLAVAILLLSLTLGKIGNNSITTSDVLIINRFDSYLKRLATLEAQTQRLNALGARIAQKNHINIDAFLLDKKPARGGFAGNHLNKSTIVLREQDLIASIRKSEYALAKQEKVFSFYKDLETVSTNKKLLALPVKSQAKHQYSSPVNKGYISSNYGYRRDPINGRHRNHRGIDIAGKTGTPINAIASGFVSFTGRKGGYGKMVEIDHSDSLKSRYAHLDSILVKKGQVVRKGENIATMGSTGRSTGPHLHLEIWQNKATVDPAIYLKDALGDLRKGR